MHEPVSTDIMHIKVFYITNDIALWPLHLTTTVHNISKLLQQDFTAEAPPIVYK